MRARGLVWAVLLFGACDGEGPTSEDDELIAARDCTTERRADAYGVGLAKTGSAFTVAFVDAMPAPPTRGDNTWRVQVTDESDAPVTDLALAVAPFMPDHMHGTSIEAHVEPGETAGEYVIAPVNLFMPGLWEVTLEMTTPDGDEDDVVFAFCVDP